MRMTTDCDTGRLGHKTQTAGHSAVRGEVVGGLIIVVRVLDASREYKNANQVRMVAPQFTLRRSAGLHFTPTYQLFLSTLFCYFLYIAVFTQNVYGTEWPFMC